MIDSVSVELPQTPTNSHRLPSLCSRIFLPNRTTFSVKNNVELIFKNRKCAGQKLRITTDYTYEDGADDETEMDQWLFFTNKINRHTAGNRK